MSEETKTIFYTYIVECNDGTLYTGFTTDIYRRLEEHNSPKKGARYTRYRQPVKLVYFKMSPNRQEACILEYKIKTLKKNEKIELINSNENEYNNNKKMA